MVKELHYPLYDQLAAIVGSKYVSDEDFAVWAYSHDVSPFYPTAMPGIIVRPATTKEVSEIVRLANKTRTPVVPRGGGASAFGTPFIHFPKELSGRSIVIDLTRLEKITDINEENMTVTAQCGITLSELSTKVEEKGFRVHTVMMPFYTLALGGVLSGITCGGIDTDWPTLGGDGRYVVGLEVVLPDGNILRTGGGPGTNVHCKTDVFRDWGGPDVTGLFIGDGGTFGIKTEATLQMFPLEKVSKAGGFLFNTFDDTWRAVSSLMGTEPFPYTGLIVEDPEKTSLNLNQKVDAWDLVYFTRGYEEAEVASKVKKMEKVCKVSGGEPGPEALEKYANNYNTGGWREMGETFSLGSFSFVDSLVAKEDAPRHYRNLRSFLDKEYKKKRLDELGVIKYTFLIPLMHNACLGGINILYDDSKREAREGVREILKEYIKFAIQDGGMSDASQGYGANLIASNWPPEFYNFMLTLKRALDPNNIINPGLWKLQW